MKGSSSFLALVFSVAIAAIGCSSSSGDGSGGAGAQGGAGGEGGAAGQGGAGGEGGAGGTPGPTISMGGIAWGFTLPGMGGYRRIEGARISVLEMPELNTTTNEQAEFTIDGIPVGSQATFVMEHDRYPLTYSKTHTVPDEDVTDLTFQVPDEGLYAVIEALLEITSEPDKCQMVSTFTRFGRTIGDSGHHGQEGALLGMDAPDGASWQEGPIYFGDNVTPDRSRDYSSLDGGVLIVNADPGDYSLSASCVEPGTDLYDDFLAEYPPESEPDGDLRCQTEDVEFESVLMKCRPGVFLNASPSYGLQALPPAE
jgi:hypothetical protein